MQAADRALLGCSICLVPSATAWAALCAECAPLRSSHLVSPLPPYTAGRAQRPASGESRAARLPASASLLPDTERVAPCATRRSTH